MFIKQSSRWSAVSILIVEIQKQLKKLYESIIVKVKDLGGKEMHAEDETQKVYHDFLSFF